MGCNSSKEANSSNSKDSNVPTEKAGVKSTQVVPAPLQDEAAKETAVIVSVEDNDGNEMIINDAGSPVVESSPTEENVVPNQSSAVTNEDGKPPVEVAEPANTTVSDSLVEETVPTNPTSTNDISQIDKTETSDEASPFPDYLKNMPAPDVVPPSNRDTQHRSSYFSEPRPSTKAAMITPRRVPRLDLNAKEFSSLAPSQLRFVGMTFEEREAIEKYAEEDDDDDDTLTPLEIADSLKAAALRTNSMSIAVRQSLVAGTSLPRGSIMRRSVLGGQRASVFHSFDPMQVTTSSKVLLKELLLIHGPDVRRMNYKDAQRDVARMYAQFQLERAVETTLLTAVKKAVSEAVVEAARSGKLRKVKPSEISDSSLPTLVEVDED